MVVVVVVVAVDTGNLVLGLSCVVAVIDAGDGGGLLKSHVHPAQYVDGVHTSMRYLQTTCSVDLVIILFRVDNTCHRSCDLVTHHTLCCI